MKPLRTVSRRQFLSTSATASAGLILGAPAVATLSRTEKPLVVGEGAHQFAVQHNWPQLPSQFHWQITHNVAVDSSGNLYVIHEGQEDLKDHPSIFVFDSDGKYIRSFGSQFQGGGHGVEIRREGSEEFLYVAAYQQVKSIAKMTLKGETVWQQYAPMESGVYAPDEDTKRARVWGQDRFMPTNFAFLNDGGFLLADGYGSFHVHRYNKDGKWIGHFGGPGSGEGKFNTPHGICFDTRPGRPSAAVVCDRANMTVQFVTLDGQYLETLRGFGLPANVEVQGNLLLVSELHARVTLLNEKNEVVARLGDDVARITGKDGGQIRTSPDQWKPGKFVHPHDACFAEDGSLFVAEWVGTGRISKLKKLG